MRELTEAELIATDIRSVIAADPTGIHPFRSDDLAVLMAKFDTLNDELNQALIRAELAEQELDAYRKAERKAG